MATAGFCIKVSCYDDDVTVAYGICSTFKLIIEILSYFCVFFTLFQCRRIYAEMKHTFLLVLSMSSEILIVTMQILSQIRLNCGLRS